MRFGEAKHGVGISKHAWEELWDIEFSGWVLDTLGYLEIDLGITLALLEGRREGVCWLLVRQSVTACYLRHAIALGSLGWCQVTKPKQPQVLNTGPERRAHP